MGQSSDEEEKYYWDQWLYNKDSDAADYLIQLYEPLVRYHVKRLRVGLPSSISTDELTSYAYVGLYDALIKFEADRDLKFDTYASFRIRGAILDGLRRDDPMPRTLRGKNKKIEAAIERLEQKHQRNVTIEEVAVDMELKTEDVHTIITDSFLGNMMSIDEEIQDNDRRDRIANLIEDKQTVKPEEHAIKNEVIQALTEKMTTLNEKEQLVVSLFYYEELTLTEIGRSMELSTSRVSQIHSKALMKLKKVLKPEILFQS